MASKITYNLKLRDLIQTKNLTPETKSKIKQELGELLYDLVLKDTSNQRSAVTGQRWKGLNPKSRYYKEKSKVAPGIANLELTGAMLDALEYKPTAQGIEIGIYGVEQALKAENHLKTTARSRRTNVPQRQFLPKRGESFRPGILKELKEVAEDIINDELD